MGDYFQRALEAQRTGDWKKAFDILLDGAAKEDGLSLWWIGDCCEEGYWLKEDGQMANHYYKRSAATGNFRGLAQMHQTVLSLGGEGESKRKRDEILNGNDNLAKAMVKKKYFWDYCAENYLRLAATEDNDCFAQYLLGEFYRRKNEPDELCTKDDRKQVFHWFAASATQGYPLAQYALSKCYMYGWGTRQDLQKAAFWLRKIAEQEHFGAQCDLIDFYLSAFPSVRNEAAAIYWYDRLKQPYGFYTRNVEMVSGVIESMRPKIANCKSGCLALLSVWTFRKSSLSVFPRDVIVLIAKCVWATREDKIWIERESRNPNKRIKRT